MNMFHMPTCLSYLIQVSNLFSVGAHFVQSYSLCNHRCRVGSLVLSILKTSMHGVTRHQILVESGFLLLSTWMSGEYFSRNFVLPTKVVTFFTQNIAQKLYTLAMAIYYFKKINIVYIYIVILMGLNIIRNIELVGKRKKVKV